MPTVKFFLIFLFFPLLLIFLLGWLIYWKLSGKKQNQQVKTRKETEKKLLSHIKNFSPTRLKNRTWQRSIGKDKKRRKKPVKHTKNRNNFPCNQ
ncbi:MAG: hypothetical protein MRECE_1c114 [Mycoplasmataceae bacterium CE_OT135]|nr:MAG: hypothetical protein MRECE_1c053 [Mycoplasmataceae bacterium CE_OT135]KLL04349.1 MAG: hypothetical protein MRECE_1c114 [Mycoplasmataceae bacterium CE_OT135]